MNYRQFFSIEQLQVLISAHKLLCDQRGVNPNGEDGRNLAARLLSGFNGDESETDMLKRFAH